MAKREVLGLFETDLANPGSQKSGEYLREHVLRHAENFLGTDRDSLIEALRDWIVSRTEPRTMIAVSVARKLGLTELRIDIEDLKRDVEAGKFFPRFYISNIERALSAL